MDRARFMMLLRRMDWGMLVAVGALLGVGVLFIYSACYRGDPDTVAPFYRKQMAWSGAGGIAFAVLTFLDYRRLAEQAWPIYAVGIALLLLVLFVGPTINNAKRWLDLPGVRVQPSEFAKLSTLLALARYLARPGLNLAHPQVVLSTGAIAVVPFVLVVLEPDLGTAAVLVPTTFMLLYAAGVPLKTLGLLVLIGLLLLPVGWFALKGYQQERILVFFEPAKDPLGAGWNKIQSQIAVGSGGLMGKGYLAGTQNVLGFLPRNVAPTDFIYSVIAEETGFVGSALVLSLYGAVITAAIRAALISRDKLGRLLSVGVAVMFFSHVFVNIAMTIGLMPITGLPLPLVSYGGSFTVSIMAALGLTQSVYVRRRRS